MPNQDLVLLAPTSDCWLFGHLIVIQFSTLLLFNLRVRNYRRELVTQSPSARQDNPQGLNLLHPSYDSSTKWEIRETRSSQSLASENKLHINKPRERKWEQSMEKIWFNNQPHHIPNHMHEMRCERFREGWATADDPITKYFLISWGNDNMKGKSCQPENK